MTLTPLEIAVFGYNANPDAIELFRYRCAHVQRLLFQPKRRRQRKPRQSPPDGLKTAAQAAAKLGCSVKTLNGYVTSGALKYVAIGHGRCRLRRMFADADLAEFIANQTRKDTPCPSTASRAHHSSILNSESTVIAFTAAPKPRPGVKPKK